MSDQKYNDFWEIIEDQMAEGIQVATPLDPHDTETRDFLREYVKEQKRVKKESSISR